MEPDASTSRIARRDGRTGRFRAIHDRIAEDGPWWAVLVVVPLLVHLPVALGRRALYFNDVTELHVPLRTFFGRAWAEGRFPLWCPDVYLGFPLFAEGQAGPLYPPNWLVFTALPAWWGVGLSFALHLSFAALGTFLFLRRFLHPAAAVAGGLAFGLCGHFALHHMHLNLVQALAWLPWCLAAAERLLWRGRARDLVLLAASLGLMALCGHPQSTVQGFGAVAAWVAVRLAAGLADPGTAARRTRAAVGVAVAMALGAGLWMVQVLPALELVEGSVRSGPAPQLAQMGQHLSPQALASAVVAGAFGTPGEGTSWLFPGGSWRPGLDLYLGAAVPFLGVLALAARRDRWTLALAACGLCVTLVAFGPLVPGVQTLFRLPGLRGLRFPDRLDGVLSLVAAALAATGVDAALRGQARLRHSIVSLAAVAVPAGAVLAWTYARGLSGDPVLAGELARDVPLAALALLAALLGACLLGRRPAVGAGLILAAVAMPLADYHVRQVPSAAPSTWEEPATARAIREAACPDAEAPCAGPARDGRVVFRDPPAPYLDTGWLHHPLPDRPLDGLAYNLPMAFGLAAVDGILPLRQQAFLDVYKRQADVPRRSLGNLRGRWVVTPKPEHAPHAARTVFTDGPVQVLEDATALPRAFAVHRVDASLDPDRAAQRVASSRDLRKVALLELPLRLPPVPPKAAERSRVDVVEQVEDDVLLEADLAAEGIVVLTDAFAPGWTATVDGEPAAVLRTDVLYRGVRVPEGVHRVRFAYRPLPVYEGALLSLGALALMLMLLSAEAWTARRTGEIPAPFAIPPDPSPEDDRAVRWPAWALVLAALAWAAVAMAGRWDLWLRSFERFGG